MNSESSNLEERRRAAIAPAIAAGIDEALIRQVVHSFYDEVQRDALIGPVFAKRVEDWDAHLSTMCDFWSGVLLMSARYKGRPMQKHFTLPVGSAHFARWIALFTATVKRLCTPEAAAMFVDRAGRIGESFQLGMAHARGEFPTHAGMTAPR